MRSTTSVTEFAYGEIDAHRRSLIFGLLALPFAGCSGGAALIRAAFANFVVVWQDDRDGRVRARGFKPSGTEELFPTIQVDSASSGRQRVPGVAATIDRFVVVWVDTGDWSVRARVFNLNGTARTGVISLEINVPWETQPGTTSGDTPWYSPRVAMASDGSFVVCWDRGTGHPARARRFLADGTGLAIVDVAPPSTAGSDVAMADDGNFVVTFANPNNRRSFIRGFRPDGSIRFGATPIQISPSLSQLEQAIAITPDGSRIVVVQGCFQEPDHQEPVLALGFDSNGNSLFSRAAPSSFAFTPGAKFAPAVAINPGGYFFATWQDDRDGNAPNIRARLFGLDGSPIGDDLRVNSTTSGRQLFPAVGNNRGGAYVFVWQDDRSGNNDVLARGLLGDDAKTESISETTMNDVTSGQQRMPRVAMVPPAPWTSVQ